MKNNQLQPNTVGLLAFGLVLALASCSKVIEIDDRLVK